MAENRRPTFDDKNETIRNPIHSGVDGHSGPEPEDDEPAVLGAGVGEGATSTPSSDLPAGMHPDEAAQGAGVLFDATKRRMVILLSTLVRLAESGDFALWCPLSAMDEQFRSLDWTSVPPLAVAKFYKLVAMTLTTYGTRLDGHAMAVLESIKSGAGLPELPVWAGEDTVQMYDMVEQIFAPPVETPAAAEPTTEPAAEAGGEQ